MNKQTPTCDPLALLHLHAYTSNMTPSTTTTDQVGPDVVPGGNRHGRPSNGGCQSGASQHHPNTFTRSNECKVQQTV
jgi:hypothetical protein